MRKYIHITCKEEGISTRDIAEKVLPVITDVPDGEKNSFLLEEFAPSDVVIEGITENSNNEMPTENIEFISKVTGYRVHLYRFISNTRRKILAYFGNPTNAIIKNENYLLDGWDIKYDSIVCNPPYNRFQSISNRYEILDSIYQHTGIKYSSYTNLYILFFRYSFLHIILSAFHPLTALAARFFTDLSA